MSRFVAPGLVIGAVVLGTAFRLWLLFHQPISSDEANAGMLATGILHGHFQAFYPGQPYGGAEPYLLALVVAILGPTGFALHLEPMLLSAVAAVLVWRIVLRLVRSRNIAALCGAAVWAAPAVNIFSSSVYQGRGVTMACGLVCLLMTLRLLDDPNLLIGKRGLIDFGLLGLAAGIGWWSLPEMTYFLPPVALLLIAAIVRRRDEGWLRSRLLRVGVLAGTALIGVLPWLWTNVKSHFASLSISSFNGTQGSLRTLLDSHFHLFMLYVLPTQLGLREYETGSWLIGTTGISWLLGTVVFAALALSLLICLAKRGRTTALAVGVLSFPILYSENPGTWFWQDGRYAVYLAPLLVMVIAVGCDAVASGLRSHSWARRLPGSEAVMVTFVLIACVLSVVAFHNATGVTASSFSSGWGYPDASSTTAVNSLESAGIVDGYAEYWVAYKLDYLSGGRLVIDTSGIGDDLDRWPTIDSTVQAARRPAWIFVRPPAVGDSPQPIVHFSAFPSVGGPNQESESVFLAGLRQARITYRIVDAGALEAVVARQKVKPRLYPGPLSIGG